MTRSQWHRYYSQKVPARPTRVFELLSDMPNYTRWLPQSESFSDTRAVEPYPVQLGSRYHDGRPEELGKAWWGTVTVFQPPGSIDFHHTIRISQLRATVDVHIHYSIEEDDGGTRIDRWLILDITMPLITRLLRSAITSRFDKENRRTMAALASYAAGASTAYVHRSTENASAEVPL